MFETLPSTRTNGRGGRALILALGLHAVAIVCIVGAGMTVVEAVSAPDKMPVIFNVALSPPPGDALPPKRDVPRETAPATPDVVAPAVSPPVIQPTEVPSTVPPVVDQPELTTATNAADGSADSTVTGPGGSGSGRDVPGGAGPSGPTGPSDGVDGGVAELVYRVGGAVVGPRIIRQTPPVYPRIAIQTRTQGVVEVQAIIDEKGRVIEVEATSGPRMLREAALVAARDWKFEPALLNGHPVRVYFTLSVRFVLR